MIHLEVNKKHKKVSKISKELAKVAVVAGMTIGLFSYGNITYITLSNLYSKEQSVSDNERQIYSDEKYKKIIDADVSTRSIPRIKYLRDNGLPVSYKITQGDLEDLNKIEIVLQDDNKSYDFLKYCINIVDFCITFGKNGIEKLEEIPCMESVKKITIYNEDGNQFFFNSAIKEKFPNLIELDIQSETLFQPGVVENMQNLKKLCFLGNENCDIDFTKLTFLDELNICGKPYDIAIWLNSEEYNTLIKNGTNVTFESSDVKSKYLEIIKKLDDIVDTLDVDTNSTDKEKLNAILLYVFEHGKYDEAVINAMKNGTTTHELNSSFYENGNLYGFLEKEGQICGNYAAMVDALSDRLQNPEKSYIIKSSNHSWNLMKIEGEYYYVDATWLDQLNDDSALYLKNGTKVIGLSPEDVIKYGYYEPSEMHYYMEKIDSSYVEDIYIPQNLPNNFYENYERTDLNNIEKRSTNANITNESFNLEEISEIGNQKVTINIGKIQMQTFWGCFVGTLLALGGAIKLRIDYEKELRETFANKRNR